MPQSTTISYGTETLAATLFLPDNAASPMPAVVSASGFGGVKEMMLTTFSEALAAAGIASLIIDYVGFGESSGELRQHLDLEDQAVQMREALTFLDTDDRFDSARLGVWGPSMAGGHALKLAAEDDRVASAVAIIPFIAAGGDNSVDEKVVAAVLADAESRTASGDHGHVPAVGHPGDFAVMTGDGAWEWSERMTANAPNFINSVTLASLLDVGSYQPAQNVNDIDVPLRVILATDDSITPARLVRDALADVPDVDYVEFPDSHFELFDENFDAVIAATTEWFTGTLACPADTAEEH